MTDKEMLDAIREIIQIELKPMHDNMEALKVQNKAIKNKLEEIDIRLTNLEEVLEAKGILPKAQ